VATQAVLYAREVDALAVFYTECVGLTLGETGEGYCELRAGKFTLWLVHGERTPAPATDAGGSVRRRSEVPVKLAFAVDSIERVRAVIEASGGSVAQRDWTFAGHRRCDAVDPEGNVIQLLEPLGPLAM
jgi:predicted enzyme related to lactoylglutathione lyase